MANIFYKRHDCILKGSYISTPIHKTQSTPQIVHRNPLQVRRGIIRKLGTTSVKKVPSSKTVIIPKSINLKRRRSVSLSNLSHTETKSDMLSKPDLSNTEEKKIRVEMSCESLEPLVKDQCDLAKQVYKMFILNAWRHSRREATKAKYDLRQAETQMDNLNIQIVVLRNLLESEKNRVATSMNEATHYRVMLEDEARQKDKLKSERDDKGNKLKRLEETLQDTEIECHNVRNELLTCKHEQAALEQQMDREREKLGKFREDKKLLLEKLKLAEETSASKQIQINKLATEKQELQQLLMVEREANKSTEAAMKESIEKLDTLEENKSYLAKEVKVLKSTNSQLVEKIRSLEVALITKKNENVSLTKSCQEQMLEMSNLRVSLAQHQTNRWTSRFTRIASVLVNVPISVFFYNMNSPLMPVQS